MKKSKANQSRGRPYRISVSVDEKIFLNLQEMSLNTGFSVSELVYRQLQSRNIVMISHYIAILLEKLTEVIENYNKKAANCQECQMIYRNIEAALTEFKSIFPLPTIGNVRIPPKLILTKEKKKIKREVNKNSGNFTISLRGGFNVEKK